MKPNIYEIHMNNGEVVLYEEPDTVSEGLPDGYEKAQKDNSFIVVPDKTDRVVFIPARDICFIAKNENINTENEVTEMNATATSTSPWEEIDSFLSSVEGYEVHLVGGEVLYVVMPGKIFDFQKIFRDFSEVLPENGVIMFESADGYFHYVNSANILYITHVYTHKGLKEKK